MALVTFTAGTPILSADVNANFVECGSMRTLYSSSTTISNVGAGKTSCTPTHCLPASLRSRAMVFLSSPGSDLPRTPIRRR